MTLPDWMRARLGVSERYLVLCMLCGVLCGLVAVGFHFSIHHLFEFLWHRAESFGSPSFEYVMVAAPTLAGLLVGIVIHFFAPGAAGSGIPEVRAAYYNANGKIPLGDAVWRFILGSLYIGLGNSLGREGPTAHMSSAIASRLGRWAFRDTRRARAMVPVGMAAGIAAAFNAPLAAITFVFEELLDNFSVRALGGIVVAVVIAAACSRSLLGDEPILSGHLIGDYHLSAWMLVALPLGLVSGVLGHLVVSSLLGARRHFRSARRFLPLWLQPAIGGLFCGLLGMSAFFLTRTVAGTGEHSVFSIGYESLERAFEGELVWQVLGILLVFKFAAMVLAYSTGGSGGLFSPSLYLGGMLGGLMGAGLSWFHLHLHPIPDYPGTVELVGGCVLLGMGASFAAIIRCPFTSLLIIIEMTGNYSLILPLMAGNILAWRLARRFRPIAVYNALLLQDGITLKRMPAYRGPQDYRNLPVSTIMTHEAVTLDKDELARDAVQRLKAAKATHQAYPVVTADGYLVGLLPRTDLLNAIPEAPVGTLVVGQEVLVAHPDTSIRDIANRMIARDLRHVPIISATHEGKLLGIVTLNDIARQRFAEESDL